jgi:hypothetical protein
MKNIIIDILFWLMLIIGRAARRLIGYRDREFKTCEYAMRETPHAIYILGVVNRNPHNGAFSHLVRLLEIIAARRGKVLIFEAIINERVKRYLVKCGYKYNAKTGNAERQF